MRGRVQIKSIPFTNQNVDFWALDCFGIFFQKIAFKTAFRDSNQGFLN